MMKIIIKTLITLAFVIGSFYVGIYITEEKYSKQLEELNSKSESYSRLIQQLHDSLNTLKSEIVKLKVKDKVKLK